MNKKKLVQVAIDAADKPTYHGRTASRMTVKETNKAFEEAKLKQRKAAN